MIDICVSSIVPVTLSLLTFTAAFTLDAPKSVFVDDQFLVNWTWLTSESNRIVIVLNEVSKAPDCTTDTSKRERSYVVLDLVNRAGSLGFYVDHPGCVFWFYRAELLLSVTPQHIPGLCFHVQ